MTSPFDLSLTAEPDAGLVEHFQQGRPLTLLSAMTAQRDALACELANLKSWRPIESAPRDGATFVDLWIRHHLGEYEHRRPSMIWLSGHWRDKLGTKLEGVCIPLFWLPLPKAPS